jgi:hypothetical protein
MEVELSKEELALAYEWGKQRAAIMANAWNKAGYARGKKKGSTHHTAEQQEALAIAAEIAGCKLMSVDYLDPDMYTAVAHLDANGHLPASCKVPDVAGIWEIRRVETASAPIRMWRKDKTAGAYVLSAFVEHTHLDNGRITPTGKVTFLGWADAAVDYDKFVGRDGVAKRHLKKAMDLLPGIRPVWGRLAVR